MEEEFWKPLLEEEKKRLKEIFPDEYEKLVIMDVYDLYEELNTRVVCAFDKNDNPTQRSDEIEHLMDAIFWDRKHNLQLWDSK